MVQQDGPLLNRFLEDKEAEGYGQLSLAQASPDRFTFHRRLDISSGLTQTTHISLFRELTSKLVLAISSTYPPPTQVAHNEKQCLFLKK